MFLCHSVDVAIFMFSNETELNRQVSSRSLISNFIRMPSCFLDVLHHYRRTDGGESNFSQSFSKIRTQSKSGFRNNRLCVCSPVLSFLAV